MRRHIQKGSQRGFSLVELLVALAVIAMFAAVSVFELAPALRSAHMTTAAQTVQEQLRKARSWAVENKAEYIVTFDSVNQTITTTAPNIPTFNPTTVPLPSDVKFLLLSGMPTTPDNFVPSGNAIDFDYGVPGATNKLKIRFEPNGSAVDDAGNLNSGAAYLAQTGYIRSQKAITLLGATGRVRTYQVVVNSSGVPSSWQ